MTKITETKISHTKTFRAMLLSAAASLSLMVFPALAQENQENVEWQKGWVAQSFQAPIGVDMPRPGERPIDRWIDPGNGLFSTDYLFAHSGTNTYLYNAGILRT